MNDLPPLVKVESIVKDLKLSLKGWFSHLKLFNRVNSPVDKRKVEIETLTQIHEQKNLNAPITNNTIVLVSGTTEAKEVIGKITGELDIPLETDVPKLSTGQSTLPEVEEDGKPKKLIKHYLAEHKENPEFFLDVGRLLFFYEERLNTDFTEEELVFLIQSSLKNNFPFWFWAFLYREKFESVTPLLKSAFATMDLKIKLKVVEVFGRFTDTAENIVELSQNEKDETVLGAMVVRLTKSNEEACAQRLISNAISRKLIPKLDYKEIKTLNAELGKNEKKFLHERIQNGWSNEKVQALNILSVTASEEDLRVLEDLIENEAYRETTFSTMHCIARIGKTNNKTLLEKQLEDARWEEFFMQVLDTLIAVKDKGILPKLLSWLKDSSEFSWKFSSELHKYDIERKISRGLIELIDNDFYEVIVEDILSYSTSKYRHLYVWRHFNLLEDVKNKDVVELIKKETRLSEYPEWKKLISEIAKNEAIEVKSKESLLTLVGPTDYQSSLFALRELWKVIDVQEALNLKSIIETFRNDLVARLKTFNDGDYLSDVKELAKNDLDYFLGQNSILNQTYRNKGKKREEEEKDPFDLLLADIRNFEIIEKEYISFVLSVKDSTTKPFLIENLGRPHEIIYDSLTFDWIDIANDVEQKLKEIITNYPNTLVKLDAVDAARRLKIMTDDETRDVILPLWFEARKELKSHGIRKSDDKWLFNHNIYYGITNIFTEIGDIKYLPLVEESVNKETFMSRHFFRYAHFHHIASLKKLLEIYETVKDEKEKESALSTLDTLDYDWTKEVLKIKA